MKKLTIQERIARANYHRNTMSNFNYIRLLKEDYPNMTITESTKMVIDKIKQGL
jgi:hypothetical protein